MKIPNKRELQQITFNDSSDIDFKDFMNFYKNVLQNHIYVLVIDATRSSDNPLHFRKNLSERISKLIMTTDDKIRDEKLQYNINREGAKISELSSEKVDKYLTGKEILPSDQKRMIEQATLT